MNEEQQREELTQEEQEIDIIELLHKIWDSRKTVIKTAVIFIIIGLIIAITSPKEYTATTIVVPQIEDGSTMKGGLSGLASMAGISLGSATGGATLSPSLYPQIVSSIPFQLELMNTKLTYEEIDHPVSLMEFYKNDDGGFSLTGTILKYTLGLPGVIVNAIRGKENDQGKTYNNNNNPIQLNKDQEDLQKILKNIISIEVNDKDGYITISCKQPEALPSAQLTRHCKDLLQKYATGFRIQKAQINLDFIQKRYNELKKEYETVQTELATFRDRNQNVSTALAQTELERINNKYQLAYNIYSTMSEQLEQARIQVKKDTPVFTTIQPASVPAERSKPKRSIILFIWTFLGIIAGCSIVFGRDYMLTFKKEWHKKSINKQISSNT
ncbi:MAG: hypothetical protein JJE45_06925 [Prolixibacteraceae bacterium]|nr:hypothetical protein [Prolixibacteraceae bacterium]